MQTRKAKRKQRSVDSRVVLLGLRLPAATVELLRETARLNRRPLSWQADIALLTGLGRQPKEKP